MDATRRARWIALSACILFGLLLTSATVLATTEREDTTGAATLRTSMATETAGHPSWRTGAVPRTTPPPTLPAGDASGRSTTPAAANTVEHS